MRDFGRDFDEPRLSLVFQYDRVAIEAPARTGSPATASGASPPVSPSGHHPGVLKLAYESNSTSNQPLVNG
jgi:hypothetical protein